MVPPLPTRRALAAALLAAALGACAPDAPTAPEPRPEGGPAFLLNPACADTGAVHLAADTIAAPTTWSASASPHHVSGSVVVHGPRLTVEAGARICFHPGAGIVFQGGGHLRALGDDTARIHFTAADPAVGWNGLIFVDEPAYESRLRFALVELVRVYDVALIAVDRHALTVEDSRIRQVGRAAVLGAPGSRLERVTVDTTTLRYTPWAAVTMQDSTRVQNTVIRGAAGIGLLVNGSQGIQLADTVRIEAPGDIGLYAVGSAGFTSGTRVRVVGGATYPARLSMYVLSRLYRGNPGLDSLVGNARDTLLVSGGTLVDGTLIADSMLPWRIDQPITVGDGGVLRAEPGARFAFGPNAYLTATTGSRVIIEGTLAAPVVLTADDPALGWGGMRLEGTSAGIAHLIGARVEHTWVWASGVTATDAHPVYADTVVFRHTGRAALLLAPGSRLFRSRVDTTLNAAWPAVELGDSVKLTSTLIRASSGAGIAVRSASASIVSCHVTGSVGDGIVLDHAITFANCNLVDNGGVGLRNLASDTASAKNVWWGDAAGPTGTNGDGVAGTVVYTPWRTSPYALSFVP